jgi:hypothetical protein
MLKHPSETTSALTEERLQLIARTIVAVRADAREVHQAEKGDDGWTFGCIAYRRTCFALTGHAESGDHAWLSVKDGGLAFTLFIDGVPLKFYRGDADKPGARNLRKGLDAAIKQVSLAFVNDEPGDWFWLLAIETNEDGAVLRLAVFQANEKGATRNQYVIPLEDAFLTVAGLVATEREGVDLPPPPVGLRTPSHSARSAGDALSDAANDDEADGEAIDPEQE